MGLRMAKNFNKRFGDRIDLVYLKKPLREPEERLRNERLAKVFSIFLGTLLGREPTPKELVGVDDISKKIKIRKRNE